MKTPKKNEEASWKQSLAIEMPALLKYNMCIVSLEGAMTAARGQ